MTAKPLPSASELARLFSYDERRGVLLWKHRDECPRHWNSRLAGKVAGKVDVRGRRIVNIGGLYYPAHRIIFKLFTGEEPPQIDHIDGNPSNNRIANLRPATPSQNSQNQRRAKNNSTGFKGVSVQTRDRKFRARIAAGGKRHELGIFETAEDAACAYRKASARFHGSFARPT